MIKLIFSLLKNRAKSNEWQVQIGAYLLKKGCKYELNEILYEKKTVFSQNKQLKKVKVITDLTFDFRTNKIHPTTETKLVKASAIKKA